MWPGRVYELGADAQRAAAADGLDRRRPGAESCGERAQRQFADEVKRAKDGPLKERLRELRFALPRVDSGFGYGTYEAVLAFQKVYGLPRTGRVDPGLWRRLWRASVPRPRVPGGDYIEVDKSRTFQQEMGAWDDPASFINV